MAEFTVLKCKLKETTPNMTFVNGIRQCHGTLFEVRDPGEGVQKNIEKVCDVEAVKMILPDKIEADLLNTPKKVPQDPELLKFATDSWNLAVELEAKVAELSTLKKEKKKSITEPENNVKKRIRKV